MRQLVNSTYVSLDGVIEDPQDWPSGRHQDDGRGLQIQTELLLRCDALLMGRRTYESFAPVWSPRSGDAFTDHINAMEKWVVSTTLHDPDWQNTTVISGDVIEEVRHRKESPGRDIVQYGFGPLAHALMAEGLIDELRLWIHPFFVGHGGPPHLIYRDTPTTMFDLAGVTALASGIVVATYAGCGGRGAGHFKE